MQKLFAGEGNLERVTTTPALPETFQSYSYVSENFDQLLSPYKSMSTVNLKRPFLMEDCQNDFHSKRKRRSM